MNTITTRAVGDIKTLAGALLIGEALENMERPGHALSLTAQTSEQMKPKLPALNLAWCASRAGLFKSYPTLDLGQVDWAEVFEAGNMYRKGGLASQGL